MVLIGTIEELQQRLGLKPVYYGDLVRALERDLVDPCTSADQLVSDLQGMESYLTNIAVGFEPSKSDRMRPLRTLLLKLAENTGDENAQLAAVSCLCQFTKVTSDVYYEPPYTLKCATPYEDMEDVFQVIVSSLANLDDSSRSGSYAQRVSILEFVAGFKSLFVMMLNCRCYGLISKMFENFLSSAREGLPENVVYSMETIMTFVFKVCIFIPVEPLLPLLAKLKKDDEHVSPVARKLAENVLQSCASKKVKKPLLLAVEVSPLADYSEVVHSKLAPDRKLCRDRVKDDRALKKAKEDSEFELFGVAVTAGMS